MRAAWLLAVLTVGTLAACPNNSGSSSSSSSGGTGGDAGSSSSSSSGGSSSSSSSGGPRSCAGQICHLYEVCVLNTDGGVCAPFCDDDGGCAGGLTCRSFQGDAGVTACLPAGGVGDPCGGALACFAELLCASTPDAGASCRLPCGQVVDDAGTVRECPANYVCFPSVADAGTGACFPR
jgi:hypothetical protein